MATGDIPADAVDLPVTNDAVSITASGSGKGFVEVGFARFMLVTVKLQPAKDETKRNFTAFAIFVACFM